MNLLVTTTCNRRECRFCFEQSVIKLKTSKEVKERATLMSRQDYRSLLARAREWKAPRVALLGGEPTRHPQIVALVDEALALDHDVLVVTNGVIARSTGEALAARISGSRLSFLVNPLFRPDQPAAERAAIIRSLGWMGRRATLGVTLVEPEFELTEYGARILELELNPVLRVSLAHPMVHDQNQSTKLADFERLGARLLREARKLAQRGIQTACDCGFIACLFLEPGTPRTTRALREAVARARGAGLDFHSSCRPLLDVTPDLTVSHCLPLSGVVKETLAAGATVDRATLSGSLARRAAAGAQKWLYPECEACELRAEGACTGGCLALRWGVPNPAPSA